MLLRVCTLTLLLSGLALAADDSPKGPKGKKYALLVGVTDYDHSAFATLAYTENDVEKLAALLKQKNAGFAQVRVLSTSRGKKDKKDAPTAQNVISALADLVKDKTKDDVVLVALAGHGMRLLVEDPKGQGKPKSFSFFCPSDADLSDVSYSTGKSETLLNLEDLFEQLGKCGAGTRLALIDACRNDLKAKTAARSIDVEMTPPRGVAALFSCGPGQRAWETDKYGVGHGVFFHFVLEALRGKSKNDRGEVTWLRLVEYVQRQVTREVPRVVGQGAKQTPHHVSSTVGESPVLVTFEKSIVTPKTPVVVEKVDGLSRFRKGLAHTEGRGARHSPSEAVKHYRESAEAGNDLGRAALAVALAQGVGVKRNEEEAQRLGKQAFSRVKASADKGDADAQAQVGRMYAAGLGVTKDEKEALRWSQRASDGGSSLGMLDVGLALSLGRGVPMNDREAVGWFRRAAGKGNADALFLLGQYHAEGRGGLLKNVRQARSSLLKASAADHRQAKELVKKLDK